ncbi:uncharacterized protein BJ212DRAFT_1324272 [Suillus subaureus]|uniref:NADP-dependent oxidoreductase domain-containing protein n=1 Tax=Suillus subaureus TaxID=48587 RepID=A0A9P7EJK2_9AGAM|nr:uncharacterized protein BJ212DRAFT_1324272 [Suillus subaureus]KAG1823446.1 hypothetical protein BJ212DRAFT_1324272 [Suillus subaureus]
MHPIPAVQLEYSPSTFDVEGLRLNILNTARNLLGIKIIAYSPLGRGLITTVTM